MKAAPRTEGMDEMVDAYVQWREECFALEGAYERW